MASSIVERSIRYLRQARANREPFGGRGIIMIHPPKCGGTSVAQSIKLKAWYSTFDLNNAASIRCHERLQEVSQELAGVSLDNFRRSLAIYATTLRKRFVYGHFSYDQGFFEHLHADYDFITVLRDPVSRFISQYYFTKKTMPLDAFLETDQAKRWASDYTNRFSDNHTRENPDDARQSAIANLNKFRVVGKLENLPRLQSEFKSAFGRSIKVPNFNQGSYSKLSAELTGQVADLCKDDVAVYNAF